MHRCRRCASERRVGDGGRRYERARQVDNSAYLCWVEGANPAAEDMAST